MRHQRVELPLKLSGIAAARDFFEGCLAEANPREGGLWVAHVDEEARCLHVSCHECDECGTGFPIGEIIEDAASRGSAGILLAHRHSSGDHRPSDSDCRATHRLADAAEMLDCALLDHLIFASGKSTSMRQLGYF